ncbi:MAG TPA: hypothetical protein VEA69_16340 [Tepidisphaeraceae bacterium]|nr:hypothetical protein [Tepidisphaeraceae bacterium]
MASRTSNGKNAADFPGGAPYSASVRRAYDARDGSVELNVTSPLLDAAIHGPGPLRVIVATESRPRSPGTAMDALQAESLRAYVTGQPRVRSVLEAELRKDRVEWTGKRSARGTVWAHARVTSLLLAPRPAASSSERPAGSKDAAPGLPPALAAIVAAQPDDRDARTSFQVAVRVEWDPSHAPRLIDVRNGNVVDVQLG